MKTVKCSLCHILMTKKGVHGVQGGVAVLEFGYGSSHDGEALVIAICDECFPKLAPVAQGQAEILSD